MARKFHRRQRRLRGQRPPFRRWDGGEDAFVRKHYAEFPAAVIGRRLDRTRRAVVNRASFLDVPKWHRVLWTKREAAFVRAHHKNKTIGWIARRLNRTPAAVQRIAKGLGITRHRAIWRPAMDAYLRRRYVDDGTFAVAQRLNVADSTVITHARKLGLYAAQLTPWTKAEDAIVLKHFRALGKRGVGQLLDALAAHRPQGELRQSGSSSRPVRRQHTARHTYIAIVQRARMLGVYATPRHLWTDTDDELLRNNPYRSFKELGQHIGRSSASVGFRARELGLVAPLDGQPRRLHFCAPTCIRRRRRSPDWSIGTYLPFAARRQPWVYTSMFQRDGQGKRMRSCAPT